jgi:outer membrane protein insertion porin family
MRRALIRLAACGLVLMLLAATAFAQGIIEDIRIHGNRRSPAETIRARMFTHPGDVYNQAAMERDFHALWNTGYFDDVRIEREKSAKGWIIQVYVKEKPTIREINYYGLTSMTQSEVLDKFKELHVGLNQESPFDPTKVKHAEVVLKELLAGRGHQFATIRTEVRQIKPDAVSITFRIHEGPKVKVGKIIFKGNKKVSSSYLIGAMKNLKPIGIPHSIILEHLFARTYDANRLSEDAERVRFAFQDKGYFKAIVEDPRTRMRDTTGVAWYFPFIPQHNKAVDITIPVEEGARYKLKAIEFTGNKAIPDAAALRRLFNIRDGDWFNRSAIGKGLDALRKAYSTLGYINETNIPSTVIDEANKTITLKIDVDEGKQFFVRRIEFTGNTTTRDKVIRRELALEEGQIYNSRLWDLSLLRLNQLNFFEPLRPEQDSEAHQDVATGTVDIDLKVKEKGKNSIGLNGGVSGLAGGFVGFNYSTNNFLGLGETLSLGASVGQYQRNINLGFTEPYMFDRPIQAGFTAYSRKFNFNQQQQANLKAAQLSQTYLQSLQNYSQASTGFTLSGVYAVPRSFHRFGLTYSWDTSDITTYTTASSDYFQYLAFRDVSGAAALRGIVTSKLVPSFSSSTLDNPMRPHSGRSYFLGVDIAGVGGNVAELRPIAEYKQFFPMRGLHMDRDGRQTLGFRVQGSFVTGFGGKTAPPFDRFFLGGDTDLRGFDIRSVSPTALIDDHILVLGVSQDGTLQPKDTSSSVTPVWSKTCSAASNVVVFNPILKETSLCVPDNAYTIPVPIQRLVYPGGDTSIVGNVEYRIPIAGPVTLALFMDVGMNMAVRSSQLRLSDQLVRTLDNTPFGCSSLASLQCQNQQYLMFGNTLKPLAHTNYAVRMSTGIELQLILPMVNAPFRLYYAYNPLRVDTQAPASQNITRSMFPAGGGGDYAYQTTLATFNPAYRILEPRRTFRLTVSTTF